MFHNDWFSKLDIAGAVVIGAFVATTFGRLCTAWDAKPLLEWLWKDGQTSATILAATATAYAAWAAVRAARAAEAGVAVSLLTAERQLRAYVYVDEVMVEHIDEPTKALAKILVKNSGQTPAYEFMNIVGRAIRLQNDSSEFPEMPITGSGSKTILNPGGIYKIAITLDYSPIETKGILDGDFLLYVFGRLTYRDAFGKNQVSCFKVVYGGRDRDQGGGMAFCKDGNTAT